MFFSHIAIIPDGNRRWAKKHRTSYLHSYLQCEEIAYDCALRAFHMGAQKCTVWLGSRKNFRERPADEVVALDIVYRFLLRRFNKDRFHPENSISRNIIGEWGDILKERCIFHHLACNPFTPKDSARALLSSNRVLTLLVGFDGPPRTYVRLRKIARSKEKRGILPELDLGIPNMPPVDLWLRTGDRSHDLRFFKNDKSCYLAVPTLWPDMSAEKFAEYIARAELLFTRPAER